MPGSPLSQEETGKVDQSSLVDTYLANVDREDFRIALQQLREVIREEAPEAEEVISYGMPGYKYKGYLVGWAAFKNHCSLFPGGTALEFADVLKDFKISKGTIQFTPKHPIPEPVVREIIRARIAQNSQKKGW
jgi:uncharacterized protein YdhG (YjbR/CyaY superfamily)